MSVLRRRTIVARACALIAVLGACSSQPGSPHDADGSAAGSGMPSAIAGSPAGTGASSSPVKSDAAGTTAPQPAQPATTPPASPALPQPQVDKILKAGCALSSVQSDLLPTNMLFVIDRSGSMLCNPPPTTASDACELEPKRADASLPSKWEITAQALIGAIAGLPEDATVGISYFSNDNRCGVHPSPSVPMLPNSATQRATIEQSLHAITPGGGTPIVGATILAYQHMHQAALTGSIFGNEFVVLITDGEQSEMCSSARCADAASCTDLLVNEEAPAAAGPGVGIRTFVIGSPGSEPARTMLSQLAKSGGTAKPDCDVDRGDCHFDMTTQPDFGKALADALSEIAGRAISCELDVPVPEQGELDLERVNVIYTPSDGSEPRLVYQDLAHGCDDGADGWQYAVDNTKIRLCGPACAAVRGDRGARVDVVLGCPVMGPQ